MAINTTNPYDVDAHIAEAYDRFENETDDIRLLRWLIGNRGPLTILEPFAGTGRILLPLLHSGHTITGIDAAHHMLERARWKISNIPEEEQLRVILLEQDAITGEWPGDNDLVILGGNCFYELATAEEQETCVRKAAEALVSGGFVYIDNDHMEGELDPSWQGTGERQKRGIQGICADGSQVESWLETVWFDASARLVRFKREVITTAPNGTQTVKEFFQQKHPVSAAEVRGWLEQYGFEIQQAYGDWQRNPYSDTAPRAIFWARKR